MKNIIYQIKSKLKKSGFVCISFTFLFGIGLIGIYLINIPEIIYFILCGVVVGILNGINSNKKVIC